MAPRNVSRLIVTGLVIFLVACGPGEPETIPLEDSNWQLVQLIVQGGFVFEPDDPGKYILNFRSENRLTGTSDCNQLSGSWLQDGNALSFEPFSTTRSLCPPGSLHNYLVLYLRNVDAHNFREGHMILTTPTEGVALEFESRDQQIDRALSR